MPDDGKGGQGGDGTPELAECVKCGGRPKFENGEYGCYYRCSCGRRTKGWANGEWAVEDWRGMND